MHDDKNIYNHTAYINDNYVEKNGCVEVTLFSYETFEIYQQVVFDWVKKNHTVKLELYRGLCDPETPVNVCGIISNIRINPLDFTVTGTIKPSGRMQSTLIDTIKRKHPITTRMRGIFTDGRAGYRCIEIKGLILMADFSAFRKRIF